MIKSIDFGFIISRVLNFYQLGSYQAVLALPIRTFWMLSRNIDRILAERDLRQIEVIVKSQATEGIQSLMTDLKKQMGTVVEIEIDAEERIRRAENERDTEGLLALKRLEFAA